MLILKLSRLRLFLAQFTLKFQISRYIVNKLLFLIIFVEKNSTNFDSKRLNQLKKHFILKLSRLRLFLAQFTLKIQKSRYIVNKLLFLIIFVEKNSTNFDIKKIKSTEKTFYFKIILLFLIIFVEKFFTNFDTKKVK